MIPSISSHSLLAATLLAGAIDPSNAGPSATNNSIIDYGGFVRCGVQNIPTAELLRLEEHFQNQRVSLSGAGHAVVSDNPITIHTYIHVIAANKTMEGGFLPESQVNAQIDRLNQDYEEMRIRFEPKDVSWTINPAWFRAEFDSKEQTEMKQKLRQGGPADLNVYINCVGCKNTLGYATFPYDYSKDPADDGVVVLYSSLPGGGASPYNQGRTLTHEVGHWLGLYHTFQGGCEGPGDLVDDTAFEAAPGFGCPEGRRSCPGSLLPDPIHNFMDYGDDDCLKSFTLGQILRARAQIATYRNITGALTGVVPDAMDEGTRKYRRYPRRGWKRHQSHRSPVIRQKSEP